MQKKLSFAQENALKRLTHEWKSIMDLLYPTKPTLDALVKKGLVEHKYERGISHWHSNFYRLAVASP
jgi:hypothetical protein